MVHRALLIVALWLLPQIAGAAGFDRWVAQQGPLVDGAPRKRVEAALLSVHPCVASASVRVHVVVGSRPGAFAWPEGDIVVTSALLDLLDDDELAAALAHELGHLLADDHLPEAAALVGKSCCHEGEVAADELGLQLLAANGRTRDVMVRMLRDLGAALASDAPLAASLARRLAVLDAAPGS